MWDQDSDGGPASGRAGSAFVKRAPTVKAQVVCDDWDDDDDDEEDREQDENGTRSVPTASSAPGTTHEQEQEIKAREESSSKIWEEANKRAPMPQLIVAPASTQSVPLPPAAALQPTLRILKRPSSNTSGAHGTVPSTSLASGPASIPGSGSGSGAMSSRGTLAEREAQYQEARSRIFGEKEKEKPGSAGLVSRTSSGSGEVHVMRDPLGPSTDLTRGFGERRRGKKSMRE